MDTLRMWHLGLNVTSTFGSSYKDDRMQQLLEFPEIILFIDNDEAGKDVAYSIGAFLSDQQKKVWVACPEKEGQDPGDLSINDLHETLRKKKPLAQFIMDQSGVFNQFTW